MFESAVMFHVFQVLSSTEAELKVDSATVRTSTERDKNGTVRGRIVLIKNVVKVLFSNVVLRKRLKWISFRIHHYKHNPP